MSSVWVCENWAVYKSGSQNCLPFIVFWYSFLRILKGQKLSKIAYQTFYNTPWNQKCFWVWEIIHQRIRIMLHIEIMWHGIQLWPVTLFVKLSFFHWFFPSRTGCCQGLLLYYTSTHTHVYFQFFMFVHRPRHGLSIYLISCLLPFPQRILFNFLHFFINYSLLFTLY